MTTTSFFGGDPSVAHWAVNPEMDFRSYWKEPNASELNAATKAQNKERRQIVKAAMGKTTYYYQFPVKDPVKKAKQKEAAEEHAARLAAHFGFPFSVNEGCFL